MLVFGYDVKRSEVKKMGEFPNIFDASRALSGFVRFTSTSLLSVERSSLCIELPKRHCDQ